MSSDEMVAVVIGRNEGDRLGRSLRSVQAAGLRAVYADSGSSDGSVDSARDLGVPVVALSADKPFSAGRGRNEGLEEALRRWPEVRFVMFLDGDCVLDPAFPKAALKTFAENANCAIVTGHLFERDPEASIYNRLCSIEWRSPAGLITNLNRLGGIMVVRVSAFTAVGCFNLNAIAGEEPDLGARLLMEGHTMIKIDVPMATHDAEILRFRQWWKRAVRGGHALAYRFWQHGRTDLRDGRRELASDLAWGLILPLATLLLLAPTRGVSMLLLASYPLFARRIYRRGVAEGLNQSDARLMARYIVYGKFAHVFGIFLFCKNWLSGDFRIIEYK